MTAEAWRTERGGTLETRGWGRPVSVEDNFHDRKNLVQPQPDIIVQIASDSPAWLTPAIAAGAAILSSFLTWLGARLNDGRKAKQDSKQRWDKFIIEEAAELQRKCETLHKLVRDGRSPAVRDAQLSDAWAHYAQLSIVAPKEVVKEATALYGLAIQNAARGYHYPTVMKRHRDARDRMTEAVRVYIGLDKLEWEPPNPEDVKVQGETVNA